MRIEIVVFDGFDDLDAFGPHEVFSHASNRLDGWSSTLVGVDVPGTVTSAHGVVLTVAEVLGEPDLVVVPGGGWFTPGAGARAVADRGVLPGRVRELSERGAIVASVCTGAMILATGGLTTGRPAVTHPSAMDALEESGALVRRDARVVDDGNLVTGGGVTSGIDLALHLVAREADPEAARTVAAHMVYPLQVELPVAAH
ncbi:DJ-1/PfpI family protein [Actinomycetospora sp. NBRC 106378]|uniref:DJ-1/PfpI family protein n=1 Tax=Actinomycetospora sp. NBRC 106378 TaxID=3032208 RepID=UPI0024A3AE09|nr:DJ-1/PfpI family protein [Actinomycetospora sp. NBRC 106378]GLZ56278.1 thimanine synthesis protein ThiJ [Actinomycetospora sp. NBRC 106378]